MALTGITLMSRDQLMGEEKQLGPGQCRTCSRGSGQSLESTGNGDPTGSWEEKPFPQQLPGWGTAFSLRGLCCTWDTCLDSPPMAGPRGDAIAGGRVQEAALLQGDGSCFRVCTCCRPQAIVAEWPQCVWKAGVCSVTRLPSTGSPLQVSFSLLPVAGPSHLAVRMGRHRHSG